MNHDTSYQVELRVNSHAHTLIIRVNRQNIHHVYESIEWVCEALFQAEVDIRNLKTLDHHPEHDMYIKDGGEN